MRRIGVLMGFADGDSEGQADIAAFRDGLLKLGWTEDRNIRIDTLWAAPADAESMQRVLFWTCYRQTSAATVGFLEDVKAAWSAAAENGAAAR